MTDLAEGHTSLAWALLTYDWDWAAADREFRRAIDLNPNYETARLGGIGLSLTWRGRFEVGRCAAAARAGCSTQWGARCYQQYRHRWSFILAR